MTAWTQAPTRHLAARGSDGIHFVPLWQPREKAPTVSVEDACVEDRVHFAVAPDRALDPFHHLFADAP